MVVRLVGGTTTTVTGPTQSYPRPGTSTLSSPYITPSTVIFGTPYCPTRSWDYYRYVPSYRDDVAERNEFDRALDRLSQGFEERDYDRVANLVPRRGNVEIFQDGYYRYSIGARDFDDMFGDLVEHTRTRRYSILEVRTYGGDSARVLARQERSDSWDRTRDVYHEFRLEYEGRHWVIRRFGTSTNRPW